MNKKNSSVIKTASVSDRRSRKAIGNSETQAYAFGAGLLSDVEGLAEIEDSTVWSVVTITTLYRVGGKFLMCEEDGLGIPSRKIFHFLAEVSESQATEFLEKHAQFVEMGEVYDRIAELDRQEGVVPR